MIASLSGRRSFDRLRARGVRRQKGPITVISSPRPHQEPHIAFAISRGVGGAVLRNRTKRRIRQVVRALDSDPSTSVGGDHLIRVHAHVEHWSHARLVRTMAELLGSPPVESIPAESCAAAARTSWDRP